MSNDDDDDKIEEFKKSLKGGKVTDSAREILNSLTAREAKVLRMRFGIDLDADHSLEEVGKQFEITRQRIREIEEKALKKLRGRGPDDDGPDAA